MSRSGLTLRGDWWGRTIARSDLLVDEARIVDLERERGLLPRLRTLGTALPGYAGGWFRLADGQKATKELLDRLITEEMQRVRGEVGADAYDRGRFNEAVPLFRELSTADDFEEFLTVPAFKQLRENEFGE